MKRLLLLSLGLALTACPTPPEEIPQQAGPNAGGAPGGGGPGGPPPGQSGGPQGEGNGPEGGPDMAPQGEGPVPNGEGPGPDAPPQGEGPGPGPDAPPQGEGPGPGPDAPPQGEGPGPDAPPLGEGNGPEGSPGEGPGPDAPPQGEGNGPEGPSPGEGEGPDAPPPGEGPEGEQGVNNTPPPDNVPEGGPPEGGVIEDSILIKVDRVPPGANNPQYTQEEIGSGQYVTFSGSATCNDCSGQLLLRVSKFLGPNQVPTQTDLFTQIQIESPGDFTVKIPTSETPISLELLVDEDNNGGPTQGERFAVIELGGTLTPDQDRSDLNLDATDREIDNPGFFGQE